jgi:hypothetical protein
MRIGLLVNPGDPSHAILQRDAMTSAAILGVALVPAEVRVPNDLDGAFQMLARERVDLVLLPNFVQVYADKSLQTHGTPSRTETAGD